MEEIVNFASSFNALFQEGGKIFASWMTGILAPLMALMITLNTIIKLIGIEKINKMFGILGKNPISRYFFMPVIGTFFFTNPMTLSLGKFLPEKYKPSYYAAASFSCHSMNGLFPHINPGELFVFLGIAEGIRMSLGTTAVAELALWYFFVGMVSNFFRGWINDFTTSYYEKKMGITLSTATNTQG
ncbi:MAG: PTS glucitol/sorbitol transporter subunit IIC [Brevinema sp.]